MPDLARADEELLSEFLLDWEESLDNAPPKSADEICLNRPDLLAELRAKGVQVDDKVEEMEYGRFGWAIDPEGNRFELWEPSEIPES